MSAARCTNCSETLAAGAKFCPRCGHAVPVVSYAPAPELGKITAPVPWAGVVFLIALLLAPAAVIAGILLGMKALIYVDVVLAVALVALVLLGNIF